MCFFSRLEMILVNQGEIFLHAALLRRVVRRCHDANRTPLHHVWIFEICQLLKWSAKHPQGWVVCFVFFSPVGGHENHAICDARKKHGRMLHKAIDTILGKGWHFTYFTISPNFWTRPTMGPSNLPTIIFNYRSSSSFMGQHWPLLIGILLTWVWTNNNINNFRLSKFQGDWTPQSYCD